MKRLIICADGTWNYRDQEDEDTGLRHATNVTKLARAVAPRTASGIDQVVIYHDGVGTHDGLDRLLGGVTGEGIEANIRDLYRSIAYNYADGDELYLFGFSRGAFTVRTLAGFMYRFGLVHKGDDFFVPDLFKAYRAGKDLRADEPSAVPVCSRESHVGHERGAAAHSQHNRIARGMACGPAGEHPSAPR